MTNESTASETPQGMSPEQAKAEKHASRLYVWLLLSAFITVPWMFACMPGASLRASNPEYLRAAATPALVHLILLFGLASNSPYLTRHTQQAIALAGLRTLTAMLIIGTTRATSAGAFVWFLVNGSLWLFGSVWGLRQVRRGDCWLMRLLGQGDQLPRPWAAAAGFAGPTTPEGIVMTQPRRAAVTQLAVPGDAHAAFDRGIVLLSENERQDAAACFLTAFRQGDAELRRRARAELERLGEVESE